MIQYRGDLWMVKLYALLPIGLALMAVGLLKAKIVPAWQGISLLLGSLLLLNPDIDLVSLAASVILAAGLIPIGWRIFAGPARELPSPWRAQHA